MAGATRNFDRVFMSVAPKMLKHIDRIGAMIEHMLRTTRIPGAAMAVVSGGEMVFSGGYGYRDLGAKLELNSETIYPIASTTKSINATLLAMLVEAGLLAWDAPVQNYLPELHLGDPYISARVTIRDMVVMRTGLARHDWLWMERPIDRADLVRRLASLELSSGFREQFQYNNLTVTTSGHVAEVVTGRRWEDLVCDKIIKPLDMNSTGFTLPKSQNVSLSYHENKRREIVPTHRLESEATAPAGGSMHSTVEDMARWLIFNLSDGEIAGRRLLSPGTIKKIQSPCVFAGVDPASPSPNSAYALGWFSDSYKDHARISHGGYLRDVQSSVMLFPDDDLGMVSFANFGGPHIASFMNQFAFNLLMGIDQAETIEEKLENYEKTVDEICSRNAAIRRVANTLPSRCLEDYAGDYEHAGYGRIEIRCSDQMLSLHRHKFALPLEHWHYDTWIASESDAFGIASSQAFGPMSPLLFEAGANGEIAYLSILLEPQVAAIRFSKTSGCV
jgi:CubicO group peptidase (beta-lactamase class C family)